MFAQMMEDKSVLERCQEIDSGFHYFNALSEDPRPESGGKLSGIYVSVKDCVSVKDMESRSGSKVLSGYRPVFDATAVARARAEGAMIIGKTSQDAFGFGSFSVNVGIGMRIPLNPFDKERTCGGSSGGAAGLTQKADFPHIAIAESTGGSIAAPAAYCGVYGLTPTYGRVSRYGLMDYASSLDKIGVMAKDLDQVARMLSIIAGFDEKDSTSIDAPVPDYLDCLKKDTKLRIGLIKDSLGEGVDEAARQAVLKACQELRDKGHIVEEVKMPLTFRHGIQTYYLISMSEASTNLAKYCGLRYGYTEPLSGSFNDFAAKVRSSAFGKEEKRRIIIGTFARMAGFRDAYYSKALKVRSLIAEEYKDLFKDYDLLISPTMPGIAPRFDEIAKLTPLQNYMMDVMTVGPNLAGLPHISIPYGSDNGMPLGLLLTADHLQEAKMIMGAANFKPISCEKAL